MQKNLTVLFAFAIFVLIVGWAITPVQAHCSDDPTHNAKHKNDPCIPDGGGGKGGGGSVELDGLFRDAVNPPDRIQSDTEEGFTHDHNPYDVVVDKHRFNIVIGSANRKLILDFTDCFDPVTGDPICTEQHNPPAFSLLGLNPVMMATHVTEDVDLVQLDGTEPVNLEIWFEDDDGRAWRFIFQTHINACPEGDGSTEPIDIRRVDANTWVIEADLQVGCLLHQEEKPKRLSFQGLYNMRFQITAVRL